MAPLSLSRLPVRSNLKNFPTLYSAERGGFYTGPPEYIFPTDSSYGIGRDYKNCPVDGVSVFSFSVYNKQLRIAITCDWYAPWPIQWPYSMPCYPRLLAAKLPFFSVTARVYLNFCVYSFRL